MARLGAAVHVVGFRRAITADTAVRLGRYFGNSTHFWLDLQGQYDIGVVEREKARRLPSASGWGRSTLQSLLLLQKG